MEEFKERLEGGNKGLQRRVGGEGEKSRRKED